MLEKKIYDDMKAAMKSAEQVRVSILRMVISEIKNKKIEVGVKDIPDNEVIQVIQKMAKQVNESIEKFKIGNREDLVVKEGKELLILEEYLPEQLSDDELETIINDSIVKTGATARKEMGIVMKDVLEKVSGRADGKIISRIVNEKLAIIEKEER